MIPVGYMAKRIYRTSESRNVLKGTIVEDIDSLSGCISEFFTDYIPYWKHNGYWLFDSPEIICGLAREHSIDLEGTKLFYYEAYEQEFDGERWRPFAPDRDYRRRWIRLYASNSKASTL